jgi:hypothetical protein
MGGIDRRILGGGQPRQRVSQTLSQENKPDVVRHTSNPSYMGGLGRNIVVKDGPGKKCKTLYPKITKAKRVGGMAQVVERDPELNSSMVKTHKSTHTCAHSHMHGHIHRCMHKHILTTLHTWAHVCTHTNVYMHMYTCTHTPAHMS